MEIPISNILLLCLIFLLIGGVIMILLQYLIFIKFSNLPDESEEQKQMNAKYTLPQNIKHTARHLKTQIEGNNCEHKDNHAQDSSALASLNFVMQFLFHEFKNSNRVRKWFYRKLSIELDELITKTTTGKLLDKLTIKELELGDQFPDIKSMSVHNVQLDEAEQRIENLDLLLDINYIGNFSTSIDADMVLGKKGSIMLKVKQLSGMARLQFTRRPYTHWSLSFLGDPELNLVIESKYQGRQMQSNITNLISNQIRKAVRRKHTLPNYKLRYKPFFHWTADEEANDCDIQPNGRLTVRVAELSRLMHWPGVAEVYCSITLAPVPFIEAQQRDNRHVLITLDVLVHKAKNQQIGIVFKQSSGQAVKIESVLPNTPACKSNLQSGDALVAIQGKPVSSIQQIAKVVKNLQSTVCSLRIERLIPGIIRNDAILEDLEKYDDLCDMRQQQQQQRLESEEQLTAELSAKHLAVKARGSNDSSLSGTPTNSPKKSNIIAKAIKKTMSRESPDTQKDRELREKPKVEEASVALEEVNYFYQHSTIDCAFKELIHMDDVCHFQLDANSRYLNVCVFGKCAGERVLLGYNNIQISQVLGECSETSLNQCLKQLALNPAALINSKTHVLSNQSGFNPNLCFGDITFGFSWLGNPNATASDSSAAAKSSSSSSSGKSQSPARNQASAVGAQDELSAGGDSNSLKSGTLSADSAISSGTRSSDASVSKAHNFIRTHFHRATQCDFCGKKIWLKDAMQCKDCAFCCHKKCIAKCQIATVCGPVDCISVGAISTQPGGNSVVVNKPEFTITQADYEEDFEGGREESPMEPALDVHRASLTGMLAQGIKRQASNLDIPGIVSTLTGTGSSSPQLNSKSLPPSPQHTPCSRKVSISEEATALSNRSSSVNPFELVTPQLAALGAECTTLSYEQVSLLTEPILRHARHEDLMNLAKSYSKQLYAESPPTERVHKINELLTNLKLALDAETEGYSDAEEATSQQHRMESKSEERVQALSIIMLYLCTGLQHAQGSVNA
ncbi:CG10362 [Drosophila busckii]|uniref:CG10362 n=1 Tax=Drosophila busckii TaxID=30019 RepID=A0A0M4EW43_DROBS|nr:PDZ domain-containing protein 8 [Drosophila busckii]ALC49610.1 CG10362 [Drosophila busckii]